MFYPTDTPIKTDLFLLANCAIFALQMVFCASNALLSVTQIDHQNPHTMTTKSLKENPVTDQDLVSILEKKFRKKIPYFGRGKFTFEDEYLDAMPYISGQQPVEISDFPRRKEHGSARLVLRIGVRTKTFYAAFNKSDRIAIGRWGNVTKENPQGLFNVQMARAVFEELIKTRIGINKRLLDMSKMTLGKYIDEHYTNDRADNPIKNNQQRNVTKKTLNDIKTAFKPWLELKLYEFNEEHPIEFRDTWVNINPNITSETMRKNYTTLNCLFNICAKLKYIPINKIDGKTYLFPKNPHKPIVTYSYKYEDVIRFIFDADTPGNPAAKIIVATMILTGARNSEVYKNKRGNFDIVNRRFYVPADISKNSYDRDIPISSDIYWHAVSEYVRFTAYPSENSYMFPTQRKSQSPHVTPTSYKKTWAAVKANFNLKDEGRLYDARHTFVKNALNTGVPVEDVSKLTGHSLETLFKHYVEKYTSDATAAAIGSFQSNKEINNGFLDQNSNIPETVKEILDAYIDLKAKKGQTPTLHDFIERMKVYRDERSLTPTARLWLEKFE